jgi:hypothetical protein
MRFLHQSPGGKQECTSQEDKKQRGRKEKLYFGISRPRKISGGLKQRLIHVPFPKGLS